MTAKARTRSRFHPIEWKLICDLIEERFGLVFDEVRRERIENELARRLAELHLETLSEYHNYLLFHPRREEEFVELAQQVTNGESYFFRERHHFEALRRELIALPPDGAPLRILSAGCSSGQEAYSIAITLVEMGRSVWEIDACDIHPLRLARAREGLYEQGSLRACDPLARRRYFEREGERFRLKPDYRRGVRFFESNLIEQAGRDQRTYDLVFCRNVLIYFSDRAFATAVSGLARTLRPGGWLLLGHSESLINRSEEFSPVCVGGKIVYRRSEDDS